MKIRVLTESGCGLTKQEANDLGIDFLPGSSTVVKS